MSNSLRVNPDVLTHGALQLQNTHEELRATLAKVASGQDVLCGTWSGSAATRGQNIWSKMHAAFTGHIDQLAGNAENLHTAAGLYRDRDEQSRASLDQQM